MTGKQKALLVLVLGAVLLLFVVALAGRRPGTGNAGDTKSSVVDWLGGLGLGAAAVTAEEIDADCDRTGDTFIFSGQCRLVVRPAGDGMRLLILRGDKPFEVEAPAPGDADFTMRDTVEPSPVAGGPGVAEARIAVQRRDGGTVVTVSCPGLGTECALRLGGGDG